MKRWLRSRAHLTSVTGALLIGVLGSLIATWIWQKPGQVLVLLMQVISFYLPIFLSFLIAYVDLRLRKFKKFFSVTRTVGVDICWCALSLNLLVLLPESIPGTVSKVNWHNRPFDQNIFVVLGLLVGYCLILYFCLYEQTERRAIYEENVQVSEAYQKECRRKEYVASFLAATALVSEAALLWHAGLNELALLFKVVGSSIIGGVSIVWLLRWDDIRSDWQQLQKMVDDLIVQFVKSKLSASDAHETLIYLGEMSAEARQQTIEYADIPEPAKSILLEASEETWQDLVYAIRLRR